jgi:antitoxin ParD1/3/4
MISDAISRHSFQTLLASGRYRDASEVVRDAMRLLEEREQRWVAVDAAIQRGVADLEVGRTHDADAVFEELEIRYTVSAHEGSEL